MKNLFQTAVAFLFFLLIGFNMDAQNAEQTVREAVNGINGKIDDLYRLAAQKKIFLAIDKLADINKDLNKEITWGTFDKTYREAKMANPGFDFNLNGKLPKQLDKQFWADYEARCDGIMANQKFSLEGMESMVKLNNLDKAMGYGSQLKTIYETFEGAAENLGTANLPKFAYDLYGNMNDFIENYKKIEKAYNDGVDIQVFEMDINRMASKARHSQELYNSYKRALQNNIIVINDFNANIEYINKLKDKAASGPLAELSYSDNNYNWDYGPYQTEVEDACSDFDNYEVPCGDFRNNYNAITTNARKSWAQVQDNIQASDDKAKKAEFLAYHNNRWTEFLEIADAIFKEKYQENCNNDGSSKAENEESTNTTPDKFLICNIKFNSSIKNYGGGKNFVDLTFGIKHKGGMFSTLTNVELDGKQITNNTRNKTHIVGYQNIENMSFSFALPDNVSNGQHTVKLIVKIDSETLSTEETVNINGKTLTQISNNTKIVEPKPLYDEFKPWDNTANNNDNGQDDKNQNPQNKNSEKTNKSTADHAKPVQTETDNNLPSGTSTAGGVFLQGKGWSAQRIPNDPGSLKDNITAATNDGNTPVGISVINKEVIMYYIDDDPLGMTSWNLEWYGDAEELQTGISNNLEQGYFPMGISFTDEGNLYVLYIMSQLSATAWQLVESAMDLTSVSNDIQPWINNKYVPVGITVFGGMYYTLMTQLPDSKMTNWTIEGYENNYSTIKQSVNDKAYKGMVPFGYLKEGNIVNILYVGF